MRCSDGRYYVVKFQENPQGSRTLANDLLGTLLARQLGLPTADGHVIDVSQSLIDLTDEMRKSSHGYHPCLPGLSFGSRYVSVRPFPADAGLDTVESYLPGNRLKRVTNLTDFIGALVFDLWTCNRDSRQFVFARNSGEGSWTATMVDQGMCFNGESWCFCEGTLAGRLYNEPIVYESITGIDSFDPWLNRLESEIGPSLLEKSVSEIPPEWYDSDLLGLRRLLKILDRRRYMVRDLLWRTWHSCRPTFPNWIK